MDCFTARYLLLSHLLVFNNGPIFRIYNIQFGINFRLGYNLSIIWLNLLRDLVVKKITDYLCLQQVQKIFGLKVSHRPSGPTTGGFILPWSYSGLSVSWYMDSGPHGKQIIIGLVREKLVLEDI